ncbi:serine/arginine repetitive matrix protein 2-like [Actinia tenebrosa]|uniref:Serine/arginine repetitive matrix protein 2-like n=1 Tax=Actinia tenebrosa TaxID=6105 RepID=A0A6P8HKZ9_ACTTE|nr:serine/arginine repetitive matrix protein 2-like [Actinia tenebrosa]
MMKADKGYHTRLVKKAVGRYYETKRKLYLQSLPENEERTQQLKSDNKLRSRRKRLFTARCKVADGEDLNLIKQLNYEYVSDEENGIREDSGKWVVRHPAWRSEEADSLMERLQSKVETQRSERPRVSRVGGLPSTRCKPRNPVMWAVQRQPRNIVPTIERSPSRSPSPVQRTGRNIVSTLEHLPSRSPSPVRRTGRKRTRNNVIGRVTRSKSKSPRKAPKRKSRKD